MATDARAVTFAELLITRLQLIGTAPTSSWRTLAADLEVHAEIEPPVQALPADRVTVMVSFAMAELRRPGMENPTAPVGAGTGTHHRRVHCFVWVGARSQREMLQAAADVQQAIWGGEAAFTAAFAMPAWDGDLIYRDDMGQTAGVHLCYLDVFIDLDLDHAAP